MITDADQPDRDSVAAVHGRLAFLLDRNRARLRRKIERAMARKLARHVDSDDVLQDAFVIASLRVDGSRSWTDAQLVAWLRRIALNRVRDCVRYHRRMRRRAEDRDLDVDMVRVVGGDAEAESVRRELAEIVVDCRESLPPDYRDVLLLRDGFGTPWSTIALLTDRPTAAAARKLFSRACAELRKAVERDARLRERRPRSES